MYVFYPRCKTVVRTAIAADFSNIDKSRVTFVPKNERENFKLSDFDIFNIDESPCIIVCSIDM